MNTNIAILPLEQLDAIVLLEGGHTSRERGLCAMEAVAWLAGEPHSDHPRCACPVIASFMRNWNDSIKDSALRSRLLLPLLPLLLNSRSTEAVELKRSRLAIDWLARECAPAWLSLTNSLKAHAVALRGMKPLDSEERCREAQAELSAARSAAYAAAYSEARSAADAADSAAYSVAYAEARSAGDSAAYAADEAARSAAYAAARSVAYAEARSAGDSAAYAVYAAAYAAVYAAAYAARSAADEAARSALQPTVEAMQISAGKLVRRMVALKEDEV